MEYQASFLEDGPAGVRDVSSTFAANLSLPIHRWFRYPAGFSAAWVRETLTIEKRSGRERVLDPFAGSGTVPLESESVGLQGVGIEAHPFMARVARAKLCWHADVREFRRRATSLLVAARSLNPKPTEHPKLIEACYPPDALDRLDRLRVSCEDQADGSPAAELVWLALASILRECSPAGTAQWQYVLPKKSKASFLDPYEAFENRAHQMGRDMKSRQSQAAGPRAVVAQEDARCCSSLEDGWADLIVTSPPYVNNYDYADATRLEMSFFGEVGGWGDLQSVVRRHLIRSCTQHPVKPADLGDDPGIATIREELSDVCQRLSKERDSHGGKKTYHKMIGAYFRDMAKVWQSLRRVSSEGVKACFVVGDSAPYGVYVPVDRWLGELAVSAGFRSFRFEKTRDRNVKWKNRKHRVPLHEGRLWVEG